MEILNNIILITSIITWAVTQIVKVIIKTIKNKKFSWRLLLGSGDFPSTHSAMVTSLAVSTGKHMGLDSAVFAVATVFSFVVIYDSVGVRRETGKVAKEINRINAEDPNIINPIKLNEKTGHTPIEVLGGVIIGIIIGIII